MEFEVKTDLSALPAMVESNVSELEAMLDAQLETYRTMVVTPENVGEAKKAKANLNKLKDAIADKRKEVKSLFLAPFEAFEGDCKRVEKKVQETSDAVDVQLKEIARQVATEKLNALQSYYADSVCSIEHDTDWIDLGRILNPKWKNQTMKLETLKQEIWETVIRMVEEAKELEKIYGNTPLFPAIWGKYLETYDKGQALAYAAILIQQEQQRQTAPPPTAEPAPIPEPTPVQTATPAPVQPERMGACTFRVIGTAPQITAVRDYMKHNRIRFEVVK